MTSPSSNDPLIGRLVDGRYRVRGRVARGGMATVYVATDLRLERRVALKVMHSHLSDDEEFRARFIQEARSAARLSDANVVPVYDQGQDGEIAYLVMEYLPGITLRDLLKEQGQLTVEQSISIMDSMLSGLAAAHRADIMHRDVKPENVLLAEDGRIKIGDFGLARATSANTATGQQLLGTIAYLAPELVTRGSAGARSDIYAAGVVLYEMLTGEQPFRGEQPMQTAYQHAHDPMPLPSATNPDVPEQLDDLVQWATEKQPNDRPANAGEMLQALRQVERELAITPAAQPEPTPLADPFSDDATTVLPSSDDYTMVLPEPPAPVQTQPQAPIAQAPIAPPVAHVPLNPAVGSEYEADDVDNATVLREHTKRRRGRFWGGLIGTLVLAAAATLVGLYFSVGDGAKERVPHLAGITAAEAQTLLSENNLIGAPTEGYDLNVPAGSVISQSPSPGTPLEKQSTVAYVVSTGPEPMRLDETTLIGLSQDDANALLGELTLTPIEPLEWFSTDDPVDHVTRVRVGPRGSTDPEQFVPCEGGCDIHQGDSVRFSVSLGPVPEVAGDSLADATKKLQDADLGVAAETARLFSDAVPEGNVIGIAPKDNDPTAVWFRNDTVHLIVSLGAQPIGQTTAEAAQKLIDAGMTVASEPEHRYDDTIPTGHVIGVVPKNPDDPSLAWFPADTVTLIESLGPELIAVPSVVGMTRDDAAATLEAHGFKAGIDWVWTWPPNGMTEVKSQSPGEGELYPKFSTVELKF